MVADRDAGPQETSQPIGRNGSGPDSQSKIGVLEQMRLRVKGLGGFGSRSPIQGLQVCL